MSRKIAHKARHVARVTVHEVWVSLQVSGAMYWPAGQDLARTLQAIRENDAAWHAAHGGK